MFVLTNTLIGATPKERYARAYSCRRALGDVHMTLAVVGETPYEQAAIRSWEDRENRFSGWVNKQHYLDGMELKGAFHCFWYIPF